MVVRRIREHVAVHNWFGVAVDLAIVVLGVFLGMQVNNWNQARLDRERGHNYAIRLIDELRTTEQSMRAIKLYYIDTRKHALAALAVLGGQDSGAGESFLVDVYQATQIFPRAGRHATYDEIVQSGSLELVGTPELRARLSNYYWRMDGLVSLDAASPPYRERVRAVMPYEVQRAIRAKCDEIITDLGNGLMAPRLPDKCSPGIEPGVAAAAAAKLRAEGGLANDLTRTISTMDSRILNFGKLEANARDVRRYMERGGA